MGPLKKSLCLLLLLSLFLGAACVAKAPPGPVSDDLGRGVSLERVPQRIVSLGPSNTEILYALGLGERVVGTDDYSDYPEEAKSLPKVGAPFPAYNLEAIVALEPDLVFTWGYKEPEVVSQLEDLGIPAAVLGPRNLEGVIANIDLVGKITGKTSAAKSLVRQLRQRIEDVASRVERATSRPRVFYELDGTDPARPWTAGPGSFVDELIRLAGGENIGAGGKAEGFQMSLEEIIRQDPQVIVLADAEWIPPESVPQRPGWEGVTAIKKGAVYVIDADLASRPGPRVVEGLEALVRLLHPELFR